GGRAVRAVPQRRCVRDRPEALIRPQGSLSNEPETGAFGLDLVDQAVVLCGLRGEPVVAVGVLADLLDGLPRPLGQDLLDPPAEVGDLPSLDLDVLGRA